MPQSRRGPDGTYRLFAGQLPTLAEALETVLAAAPGPRPPAEHVWLDQALGRFLAADVTSDDDIPGFDRSTVDGYAVRAVDTAGASAGRPVVLTWAGRVAMGRRPAEPLKPGEAVSVATGAMLPEGADAVVMIEDTVPAGDGDGPPQVAVTRAVSAGDNVLRRGSDVRRGEVVLTAGTRIGPAQVGALAAVGVVEVPVHRLPTVAVISTGDELVAPQEPVSPGTVRDANAYALAAAVRRDGGRVQRLGRVGDDGEALAAVLADSARQADLVLVSGGSSVGTRDLTLDAVEELGAEVLVHGIAVKPGKPTLVARRGTTLFFGLPGNPVSALVIYDLLVRPVLRACMGAARTLGLAVERAVLAESVRRPPAREELVRVRLVERAPRLLPVAEPVPGTSGMLQSLARADGYLWIGFEREGFEAGEIVEIWRIPGD